MKRTFVIAALCSLAIQAPLPAFAQNGHSLGIDTANFDRSVRPQDDFFRFVNGGWLKRTEIPADASNWGAFSELRERSRDALHTILEEASKSNAPAGKSKASLESKWRSPVKITATVVRIVPTQRATVIRPMDEIWR